MDSETKTFYFIVIVWLLLVLLGSLLQRCCVHRDLHSIHTSYLYGDTGPPTDYFSQGNEPGNRTGYDRSPEYLITCLEQRGGPSIRTNEVDKPPSYDGDPPTYSQAMEMERNIGKIKKKEMCILKEIEIKCS